MKTLNLARAAGLKALFLVFVSIAMMVVDHRYDHLDGFRSNVSLVISPLRYLVSLPTATGNWASSWYSEHAALIEENAKLKINGRILKARLQKLKILAQENARLRKLLSSSRKIADDVIVAELLSVDQNPYRQLIEINKGSNDGVEIGLAVIDDFGVMGQVIHVNPQSATTMLISDPEHGTPVQFIRNGTRSIAFGSGSTTQLELRYLPATADILIGDELVTSGLGGRFPAEYPVARVTAINEDLINGFISVIAEPRARLDSSREVLIIKPRQ